MLVKKPTYSDMNGKIKLHQSCKTSIRDAVAITLSLEIDARLPILGTWKRKPLSSTIGNLKAIETQAKAI